MIKLQIFGEKRSDFINVAFVVSLEQNGVESGYLIGQIVR
jgi:hypothetical protein